MNFLKVQGYLNFFFFKFFEIKRDFFSNIKSGKEGGQLLVDVEFP